MKAINPSKLYKKRLGDYVVNPYIGCEHGCAHCYCPAMPGVWANNSGHSQREWGDYLIPKIGVVEAVRRELRTFTPDKARGTEWGGGMVLMSFLTDCYTPTEGRLRLTRQCLQLLLEAGHRVRILTRSVLAMRDFDLLKAHPGQVLFGSSIPHLDDDLARTLEPRAAAPSRRLKMLIKARAEGIPTFAVIAPVLPGHGVAELASVIGEIEPHVTREIFCEVLNVKGSNLALMKESLGNRFPDHLRALGDYSQERWAEHTWQILSAGVGMTKRWVPWPDTGKGWKKHLSREQTQVLTGWLPVGA